jgi:alkylation response protein AidB-like acyl-CoA dehydrogenase
MDFKFPEELEMLRQMVRKFVDQELKPIARQIDEREVRTLLQPGEVGDLFLLGL